MLSDSWVRRDAGAFFATIPDDKNWRDREQAAGAGKRQTEDFERHRGAIGPPHRTCATELQTLTNAARE